MKYFVRWILLMHVVLFALIAIRTGLTSSKSYSKGTLQQTAATPKKRS